MRTKAKKSFGQHFLTNEPVCEKIANSLLAAKDYPRVLEIGPGQGVLTKYLMQKDYELFAVDADKDMIAYMIKKYPNFEDRLILADCLKINFFELFNGQQFNIIGNFPYNISSQIIFKILKNPELVPEMVGMFQKEMADRVIAPHGSKTYGVISVLTQALYSAERLFNIAPGSFSPPPKVNSSVIRLVRKEGELGCDYKKLRMVVKNGFSQRRKMLRNTMKPMITDPTLLEDPIFVKRPEQLSLEDFVGLTNRIFPEE